LSDTLGLPRTLALEGASNVRDLGGYRTKDGRRVKFGRIYRAAALSRLTEADAAALRQAGIGRVVDLRGGQEREHAPSRLGEITIHPLSIEPSLGASIRDIAARREATDQDIVGLMCRAYTAYAMDWHHRYAAMFALLLEEKAPALLFHCTAGKDRTGFGAALVLAALGVDRATVHADYLATNRLWRGDPELRIMLPPVVADVLMSVRPDFLDAAFTAIIAAHGSVDTYLAERLNLTRERRLALQASLLDPD
jgi:protein-tyrosine phosphatase